MKEILERIISSLTALTRRVDKLETGEKVSAPQGSVLFGSGSGATYNASRLVWDDTNFRLGVNKTLPTFGLHLGIDSAAKPGTNVWTVNSDGRIKEQVRPYKEGLSLIQNLQPVYFRYKPGLDLPTDQDYVGFIAQDLEQVAPRMVEKRQHPDTPEDEQLFTNVGDLQYILINAVQEIAARLDKLEPKPDPKAGK